jgi:coenzyme F420-reducing hydrogenase delta subunit
MTIDAVLTRPAVEEKAGLKKTGVKLTVFHCFNAIGELSFLGEDIEIKAVNLPCSGMTRETVLLKAFEAGADGVVVLVCPEGSCRYLQGNLRAQKRVGRVKQILDDIGLDGRRLNIYNVPKSDKPAIENIIRQTVTEVSILGPNPAV